MTETVDNLLEQNHEWAESVQNTNPELFTRLTAGQEPVAIWISCCDSRLSLATMLQADLGCLFVVRNIANQVRADDPAVQAALRFGIHNLGIDDVVVCGHSQCGGVAAALQGGGPLEIRDWLQDLSGLSQREKEQLQASRDPAEALARLNVRTQAENVRKAPAWMEALESGRSLRVHSWFFRLDNGYIEDLDPR